jgi:hypothetical protein
MGLTNGREVVSAALAAMNVMTAKMKMQQDLGRIIQTVNRRAKLCDVLFRVNEDDTGHGQNLHHAGADCQPKIRFRISK